MTALPLRTARLVLRHARPEDLDAFHAMRSDPVVMRYSGRLPHTDREESRAWLASMLPAAPDEPGAPPCHELVIERDGEAIGKVGVWRDAEIGFLLASHVHGQGYGTEALTAFLGYARAAGFTHLDADVDPRNAASLALLARLGFREVGRAAATCEVDGEAQDSVYLRAELTGG